MKLKRITAISLLTLMLGMGTAQAKTPEFSIARKAQSLSVSDVNNNSPEVTLSEVGKEVAPGVIQVNPETIKGKKLVIDQESAKGKAKICIGVWSDGTCWGIYIE